MIPVRKIKLAVFLICFIGGFWFVLWTGSSDRLSDISVSMGRTSKYIPVASRLTLETIQRARREHVRTRCNYTLQDIGLLDQLNYRITLQHIIVDDDHQLLYCYVPKVATTNWKKVFLVLTGTMDVSDPSVISRKEAQITQHLKTLGDFEDKKDVFHRLNHYTKFMFVRHPFDRAISAYRDKFVAKTGSSKAFQKTYGARIIQRFRQNATNESLSLGHDVTFAEFVDFLTIPRKGRKVHNEHWRPMVDLCRPCHIQYDIIGKYETLLDDIWFVFKTSSLKDTMNFPSPDRFGNSSAFVKDYLNLLSPLQIQSFYQLYESDFQLFNYDFNKLKGSLITNHSNCSNSNNCL